MAEKYRSWQCPPQAAAEQYKLGWLNEQAEDGIAWNKQQRGWADHHKSFEILAGKQDLTNIPKYRSTINTARLKRNIRQIRGAVCNIRPISGFTSANPAFAANAKMMNDVTTAIYQERHRLPLALRSAFDWAAATTQAWIHPVFRRDFAGHGKGSLQFDTFAQPCVLPTQLPSSGDFQKAYAVSVLDEVPIYIAHGLFPKFQDRLHPTSSRVWYSSEIRTAARGNLLQRMFGSLKPGGGDNQLADAYVPIRKTWVIDLAQNDTGDILYMGDWTVDGKGNKVPASSWSYMVYSKGQNMKNGRQATENDARIYPFRRLIISSESCVMYDGPAFDWHGELPLVQFCLDDWAFDPAGFSIVHDGYSIQQGLDEIDRATMDKIRAQGDTSLAYDINSVTTKEAMQFDPMQPRGRVGYDGSVVDKPFTTVIPEQLMVVRGEVFTFKENLQNELDYQMGVNDIGSMARARGLVSSEGAMERLMEASGPIVMDITASVEVTIANIGQQVKFIIPQFYTTRQIMSYVGPNSVTQSTMDFDPEKLIPSHMPDEATFDSDKGERPVPSKYDLRERALFFADSLVYTVAPHTAHEITQMAVKLGLVQLRKAGVQISSRTIAEAWNISNFGGPDGDTEYERYMNEQMDVAKHAILVKQLIDTLQQAGVQINPAMQQALSALMGGQSQEGRPPVGTEAPQVVNKDGGARSTVSQTGS